MGASQGYGKILNTLPEYVENADNAEVIKLYRNSSTSKWYTKNNAGTIVEMNIKPQTYKIYRALITQAGGEAPTVIVLENTLRGGAIVWTRSAAGTYNGTLADEFTADKTELIISNSRGGGRQFSFYRNDVNELEILTEAFNAAGPSFDLTDAILNKTTIEIRVND